MVADLRRHDLVVFEVREISMYSKRTITRSLVPRRLNGPELGAVRRSALVIRPRKLNGLGCDCGGSCGCNQALGAVVRRPLVRRRLQGMGSLGFDWGGLFNFLSPVVQGTGKYIAQKDQYPPGFPGGYGQPGYYTPSGYPQQQTSQVYGTSPYGSAYVNTSVSPLMIGGIAVVALFGLVLVMKK